MTTSDRIGTDDLERQAIHDINPVSSGRAVRASCPRPATAGQAREPDSPSGLRPLPLPCGKVNYQTTSTQQRKLEVTTRPQQTTTDDRELQVIHNVNEFGWHCVNVIEDDGHPPWTYTWNHPELPGTPCHFIEVADRYYSDYVGFLKWYYRRMAAGAWPGPKRDMTYSWKACKCPLLTL
jgi:hypothetical protein